MRNNRYGCKRTIALTLIRQPDKSVCHVFPEGEASSELFPFTGIRSI